MSLKAMRFFETSVLGRRDDFVYVLMITEFRRGMELDVFYTMLTETMLTSLLLYNYNVITCIYADA